MNELTAERLTAQMQENDWASLYGAISCALYNVGDAPDASLDRQAQIEVLRRLPATLRARSAQHGFEDDIVEFLQDAFEASGSFEAFLQTSKEQS